MKYLFNFHSVLLNGLQTEWVMYIIDFPVLMQTKRKSNWWLIIRIFWATILKKNNFTGQRIPWFNHFCKKFEGS